MSGICVGEELLSRLAELVLRTGDGGRDAGLPPSQVMFPLAVPLKFS